MGSLGPPCGAGRRVGSVRPAESVRRVHVSTVGQCPVRGGELWDSPWAQWVALTDVAIGGEATWPGADPARGRASSGVITI